MAAKKPAPADAAEAKGGGNKKMILIVIVITLVAIILSAGVTWFLLGGGKGGDEAEQEKAAHEEGRGPGAVKPALYLDIQPGFVITYNDNSRQRYMQVFVSLMTRDQAAIDAMQLHMPVIKSQLNLLFSGKDFKSLQSSEGREALRADAAKTVNEILSTEAPGTSVEQVLFTNFVMQ